MNAWMKETRRLAPLVVGVLAAAVAPFAEAGAPPHSVARQWNDQNLEAIRNDFARPTVPRP